MWFEERRRARVRFPLILGRSVVNNDTDKVTPRWIINAINFTKNIPVLLLEEIRLINTFFFSKTNYVDHYVITDAIIVILITIYIIALSYYCNVINHNEIPHRWMNTKIETKKLEVCSVLLQFCFSFGQRAHLLHCFSLWILLPLPVCVT